MILLNDPAVVERLLLLITRQLGRFGLRVNQKKVDLRTVAELQEHRCRATQAIFAKKGNNQNPVLVRQFVDAYLAIPKPDLEKTWNRGVPLLNRLLWSNLESLPKSLFNAVVARLTSEQYLLRADCKKLARVYELNGKRTRPIDLGTHLRKIGDRSVHNSYHYEALAFANSVKDADLRSFCEARLASLDKLMNSV